MKIDKNHPHYYTDADGRRLVTFAVTDSARRAVTEAALYDNARARGDITGRAFLNSVGKRHRYVTAWNTSRKRNHPLSRSLLGCTMGYKVRFNDGNTLNLLPENLRLVAVWLTDEMARMELEALLTEARRAPAVEPEANGNG